MRKTKSPGLIGFLSSLAFFDESIYPFSALILLMATFGLQSLPLLGDHWPTSVVIILWIAVLVLVELGLRLFQNPLQLGKVALKQRGISFDKPAKTKWKAWSLEGLTSIANQVAFYAVIFTVSSGWKAVLGGLLASLGLAGFCWVFLSLSDSWSKKGKRVTVLNALCFLVLMGIAFESVVFGLAWIFDHHA